MTRVLLAEDHALVREGLKLLLAMRLGLDIVGETGDGAAVERLTRELAPDLLVLDLDLPGCHGIELTARIKALKPAMVILVVTGKSDAETVGRALGAGADGYVLKHHDSGELMQAVEAVLAGRRYVSRQVAVAFRPPQPAAADAAVTPREREIMCLVARGMSNQDIATVLHISLHTVRTHRQKLMEKLGLRNAADIAAFAVKRGICERA